MVDTTPPIVTIQSPVNGTIYNTTLVDVNYTASDANSLTCEYSLDGNMYNWTNLAGCANKTLNLANGNHNITLRATDAAGNSNSSTVWFVVNVTKTGNVTGLVKDNFGTSIANATVVVESTAYSATTNSSGYYIIANIPIGTYTITASKAGYVNQSKTGQTVSAGSVLVVNFTLTKYGVVNGTIRNFWNSSAIADANITAKQGESYVASTLSGADGSYSLSLAPGTYDIFVTASGYTDNSVFDLEVQSGATITQDFWMW
jgi:hypothetical protein